MTDRTVWKVGDMAALPARLHPRASASGENARCIVGVGQKMYLTYRETITWLEGLLKRADDLSGVDLLVLPSFPALDRAHALLAGRGIFLGAQDLYWQDRGAFTGEVSPLSLAELGCTFVEIGHAERRRLFGETDETVRLKTAAALAHQLVPIICVGEEDKLLEESAVIALVLRQVRAALEGVPAEEEIAAHPIVVAYEPVWAIGTTAQAHLLPISSPSSLQCAGL